MITLRQAGLIAPERSEANSGPAPCAVALSVSVCASSGRPRVCRLRARRLHPRSPSPARRCSEQRATLQLGSSLLCVVNRRRVHSRRRIRPSQRSVNDESAPTPRNDSDSAMDGGSGDGASVASSPHGSATKHFVWGWGRLTAAPLLLNAANAPDQRGAGHGEDPANASAAAAAASSGHSPSHAQQQQAEAPGGSPTSSSSPNPAFAYPFPSALSACTLSPTLIEAMETNSVRAIHTSAHHTVAITHGGHLYSWTHSGLSENGPAVEVDPLEYAAVVGRTSGEAKMELGRLRTGSISGASSGTGLPSSRNHTVLQVSKPRSGSSSRAESPVPDRGSSQSARVGGTQPPRIASSAGAGVGGGGPLLVDKKFRRVVGLAKPSALMTPQSSLPSGALPPMAAVAGAALGRNQMLAVTTSGQVYQWNWESSSENPSSTTAATTPTGSMKMPPPHGSAPSSPRHVPMMAQQSSHASASPNAAALSSSVPRPPPVLSINSSQQASSPPVLGVLPSLLALPPSALGRGPTLVNGVSCGGQFHLLSTAEGTAYSWGRLGTHGRLGQGPPPAVLSSMVGSAAAATAAAADAPDSNGFTTPRKPAARADSQTTPDKHSVAAPRLLQGLNDQLISRVAAGWAHGAVIAASGQVFMFGCGLSGRLGSGNQLDQWTPQPLLGSLDQVQIVEISLGYHHSLAVDVTGRVWCWGGNDHGQLGLGDRLARGTPELLSSFPDEIVALSCGAFHSAAVSAVGDLWTWGNGRSGQLGFGDTASSSVPRLVSSLNGMDVCLVSCGGDYTIAVTDHFMVVQLDYFSGQAQQQTRAQRATSVASASSPDDEETASYAAGAQAHAGLSIHPPGAVLPKRSSSLIGINALSSPSPHSAQGVQRSSSAASAQSMATPSYRAASPLVSPQPLPPPTPVIFEEHVHAGSSEPTLPSGVGAATDPSNDDDEDHSTSTTRLRMSASSNALGDLVGSGGVHMSKSNSFSKQPEMNTAGGSPRLRGISNADMPSRGPLSGLSSLSLSAPSASPSSSASASLAQKTIFQLVKEVFAFPPLPTLDIRSFIPTAKVVSSFDAPLESSDLADSVTMGGAGISPSEQDSLSSLSMLSAASSATDFRPSGLSGAKKSSSEVARQRDEVARMNAAYKTKLRKEAKGKELLREEESRRRKQEDKAHKEQAKKTLEREQRMDEAADIWLKQIVPVWHTQTPALLKKTKELVAKVGIPPRVRGVVWPLALGNALMITQELYEIFGQQAQRARKQRLQELKALNNAQEGQHTAGAAAAAASSASATASPAAPSLPSSASFTLGRESTFSYIDVDLTRTYPSLAFFQEECPMNDQLRHLLYTYWSDAHEAVHCCTVPSALLRRVAHFLFAVACVSVQLLSSRCRLRSRHELLGRQLVVVHGPLRGLRVLRALAQFPLSARVSQIGIDQDERALPNLRGFADGVRTGVVEASDGRGCGV